MRANLFKNFKTLKEKEVEKDLAVSQKVDNVSVKDIEEQNAKSSNIPIKDISEQKLDSEKVEQIVVIKNRPIKKEILEARKALQEKSVENSEASVYAKNIEEDSNKRTYTVFLKEDSLEFIKDLVFYKATAERQIFYNQSEALVEALSMLMEDFKNIKTRPDFIKEQEKNKKGGRKRFSDENFNMTTTVYIPNDYFEFIRDVNYSKVVGGNLYYKDWDLLEMGIVKLKEKYGSKVEARPDYIREDEKLRGRKAKA